jgi:general secretion pathway protein G
VVKSFVKFRKTYQPGVAVSRKRRGFTLIEMLIVISLILIMMAVVVPMYKQSILKARETTLRGDLFTLRRTIDEYTYDKKKAPKSLDDLVAEHYIREIPKDPMTKDANWQVTDETDVMQTLDQLEPGIDDVHSSSNLTSTEGTAYSSW